jgi:hypothetical protein
VVVLVISFIRNDRKIELGEKIQLKGMSDFPPHIVAFWEIFLAVRG